MKISSRIARLATSVAVVGIFVVGGGVSSISARAVRKVSVTTKPPTLNTLRTKNGALPPVTTQMPKLGKGPTTTAPRVKNGVPKSSPSMAPKGSGK